MSEQYQPGGDVWFVPPGQDDKPQNWVKVGRLTSAMVLTDRGTEAIIDLTQPIGLLGPARWVFDVHSPATVDTIEDVNAAERNGPETLHGPGAVCPECRAHKHGNCDGTAWDEQTDTLTWCSCSRAGRAHRGF